MAPTLEMLRVLVKDDAVTPLITDDEVNVIISIEDNVYRAAASLAAAYAAYFAKKGKLRAGPVTLENQTRFEHYNDLAKYYDQRAREGGGSGVNGTVFGGNPVVTGISETDILTAQEDTDRYPAAFSVGLMDNGADSGETDV